MVPFRWHAGLIARGPLCADESMTAHLYTFQNSDSMTAEPHSSRPFTHNLSSDSTMYCGCGTLPKRRCGVRICGLDHAQSHGLCPLPPGWAIPGPRYYCGRGPHVKFGLIWSHLCDLSRHQGVPVPVDPTQPYGAALQIILWFNLGIRLAHSLFALSSSKPCSFRCHTASYSLHRPDFTMLSVYHSRRMPAASDTSLVMNV